MVGVDVALADLCKNFQIVYVGDTCRQASARGPENYFFIARGPRGYPGYPGPARCGQAAGPHRRHGGDGGGAARQIQLYSTAVYSCTVQQYSCTVLESVLYWYSLYSLSTRNTAARTVQQHSVRAGVINHGLQRPAGRQRSIQRVGRLGYYYEILLQQPQQTPQQTIWAYFRG
jgi:hypothetical protein